MRIGPVHRSVAVLVLALLAVAGCSGKNDDAKAASATGVSTSVDTARVSPADLVTVPKLDHPDGAIRDVTFGHCSVEPGDQTVHATILNSATSARDYVVTVSWVNATSDVLARAVGTKKAVAPGSPIKLTVDTTVPKGVAQCTFHVDAGTLP